MDTIAACLIAGGGHNTTLRIVAHGNGLALQFRVVALFYGSIELVHVHMNNLHNKKNAELFFYMILRKVQR